LEWDTKSKEIVAYHKSSLGYAADPYVDPSGKYVILLANDGGKEATIVKTGNNGEPSERIAVVETAFSEEYGEKGIWDVCFIQHDDYDIALFVSTLSNFVVLADMSPLGSGGIIQTQKIWLTDDPEAEVTSNHGRGARRNCAWAFGSPYVWVDAGKTEEVHILKLSLNDDGTPTATRIRNVVQTPSRFLAWVSNHEKDELLATALANSIAAQKPGKTPLTASSVSTSTFMEPSTVDSGVPSVAIAALVFGVLAFAMGLLLFVQLRKMQNLVKRNSWTAKAPMEESPMESGGNP
jgi:hypothetical protein